MELTLFESYQRILLKESHNNPFFKDKTGVSYYDGALEKDLYYFVQKNIKGSIIEMEVDKYMALCSKLQNTSFQEQFDFVRQDNVNKIKKLMSEGVKFDLPYLFERLNGRGEQEGRHRVIASKELGNNIVPVAYFKEISDDDLKKYGLSIQNMNPDEAKTHLSKLGFKDVSMFNMVSGRLNFLAEK